MAKLPEEIRDFVYDGIMDVSDYFIDIENFIMDKIYWRTKNRIKAICRRISNNMKNGVNQINQITFRSIDIENFIIRKVNEIISQRQKALDDVKNKRISVINAYYRLQNCITRAEQAKQEWDRVNQGFSIGFRYKKRKAAEDEYNEAMKKLQGADSSFKSRVCELEMSMTNYKDVLKKTQTELEAWLEFFKISNESELT